MPAPIQLLGLLPPTPETGWPSTFALQRVLDELNQAETARRLWTEELVDVLGPAPTPPADSETSEYVRVDARYPARRRAQRLSYSVWQVIASYVEGLELTPVLEVPSVADRLRLALIRLRDLTAQGRQIGEMYE